MVNIFLFLLSFYFFTLSLFPVQVSFPTSPLPFTHVYLVPPYFTVYACSVLIKSLSPWTLWNVEMMIKKLHPYFLIKKQSFLSFINPFLTLWLQMMVAKISLFMLPFSATHIKNSFEMLLVTFMCPFRFILCKCTEPDKSLFPPGVSLGSLLLWFLLHNPSVLSPV